MQTKGSILNVLPTTSEILGRNVDHFSHISLRIHPWKVGVTGAEGLTFPTALTWDDEGQLYMAEAGGLNAEQLAPSRIVRIEEDGQVVEVANLSAYPSVFAAVVGLIWHEGAFYFTHRDGNDTTGAVSRFTPEDEQITQLFSGIIDSQAEHQINDIEVGSDGRMYVTIGPAGNAGVVDRSIAPALVAAFAEESREVRTTGESTAAEKREETRQSQAQEYEHEHTS